MSDKIDVVTFCDYFTNPNTKPSDQGYEAQILVQVAKGIPGRRIGRLPVELPVTAQTQWRQLGTSDRDKAVKWFGWFGAQVVTPWLARSGYSGALLIPVPGSQQCSEDKALQTTTSLLAESLRKHCAQNAQQSVPLQFSVLPNLYWKSQQASAHRGGSRSVSELVQNLEWSGNRNCCAILVDDVVTTGSHLLAAQQVLNHAQVSVLFAICLAETTHERNGICFRVKWCKRPEFLP